MTFLDQIGHNLVRLDKRSTHRDQFFFLRSFDASAINDVGDIIFYHFCQIRAYGNDCRLSRLHVYSWRNNYFTKGAKLNVLQNCYARCVKILKCLYAACGRSDSKDQEK